MATGLRILLAGLLLTAGHAALADSLPDPTRPAIDLNSVGGAAEVVPEEDISRGLQSIIISPSYRAAIINGEKVFVGGKTGDSRLVEVRESSVVLQNAQGKRVLELFPKVSIKKNEAVLRESTVREKASGQTSSPENAVGGAK
jgi:MSHA biogenesis protein MshK